MLPAHRPALASIAAAGLLLAACGSAAPEITPGSPTGACTVSEPGTPSIPGAAAYVEHVTPTAGGGFGVGSLGVTVSCITGGTAPDHVVLILPNLERGKLPPVGDYRIRSPADSTLTRAEFTDPRLAWARVQRGAVMPVLFAAKAGRVSITRSEAGILEGAYQVALGIADTAVALPGARREVAGEVGTDSLGHPVVGRTVLGGAFVAPKQEADWRGL